MTFIALMGAAVLFLVVGLINVCGLKRHRHHVGTPYTTLAERIADSEIYRDRARSRKCEDE